MQITEDNIFEHLSSLLEDRKNLENKTEPQELMFVISEQTKKIFNKALEKATNIELNNHEVMQFRGIRFLIADSIDNNEIKLEKKYD